MTSSLEQLSALAVVKLSEMPLKDSTNDDSNDDMSTEESKASPSSGKVVSIDKDNESAKAMSRPLNNNNNNNNNSVNINLSQAGRCQQPEWARQITSDERKFIREKIKAAYLKKMANSFDELLETCAAIEEELVFFSAPSRLDYFKTGVQFEKRVAEKRNEIKNAESKLTSCGIHSDGSNSHHSSSNNLVGSTQSSNGNGNTTSSAESTDLSQSKPIKRAKTNH